MVDCTAVARAREQPADLRGGDQRPRGPLRTASVAGGVIESPAPKSLGGSLGEADVQPREGAAGPGFPFEHLLPSRKVGFISLAVLAAAAIRSRAERLTLRPSRAK